MFKRIPGFNDYEIDENGNIRNIITGKMVKQSNSHGYRQVNLFIDKLGYSKKFRVHRLVLMTFKPIPEMYKLVVNHKDFNKSNNNINNLEWCTIIENNHHAGRERECESCKPVYVKDCLTGKITYFNSMQEAGKAEGTTRDAIIWRLKQTFGRVFPNFKQYKFYHDKREFPEVNFNRLNEISKMYTNVKPIVVYYLMTGETKVFEQLQELANEFGVVPSVATEWDKERQEVISPHLIMLKYIWDDTPWRTVEDPYLEIDMRAAVKDTSVRRVVVTARKGKVEKIFMCAADCARYYNIRPTLLDYRLKGKRYAGDIQFLYYIDYYVLYGSAKIVRS